MKSQWMIYGANGYSAQLAIEKAVKQGKTPILAGRKILPTLDLGSSSRNSIFRASIVKKSCYRKE
tara:strand:- start:1260 stop:1454 length:195 start_codon:yes stop_codon:yes gene_type:complete